MATKSFDVAVDLPLTPSSSDSPPAAAAGVDAASPSHPPGPQSRSWRWRRWRAQLLGEEGEAMAPTVWTDHCHFYPVGSVAASCFPRAGCLLSGMVNDNILIR